MKPGSKKSIVWRFYKKSDDKHFVICQLCKKQFKYFGNTTNLSNHLKRIHPVAFNSETELPVGDEEDPDQPRPSTSKSSDSIKHQDQVHPYFTYVVPT